MKSHRPALVPAVAMLAGLLAAAAHADGPQIVDATAARDGSAWRIAVTLRHPDTGWDHYADGWEVLGPDGSRLGFRELFHPHVNEQPFTRALGGIDIPDGTAEVTIRARCNVDGWGEAMHVLHLTD
ncbi:hypothetical protein DKT77_03925 [Meridianimarinicoccus roseus]|uniref:Uncharacterized protein n=1 Tax=Meridianimarinicoccus roseus TaxID=2072018 RepID=A0A2V2LIN5_9RHOB|nr:hypothetical protein [Meridianimarinicoccus roseus]PWR03871.1 hypothetical protein DKT77_03925 [Meridianimarinicoccus roseus]